jgi:hypothetical protein
MAMNYDKLRGKIREVFKTEEAFAGALQISRQSLSAKLNGKIPFTQAEMDKSCELLDVEKQFIPVYFFTPQS